jgi:flagellar motor component MotA
MANGKGNLAEINSRNIITVKSEELPEESRKEAKEFQRALLERRKAFKEELKVDEEKEMQALLSCFKKDRHCGVTQIQGVILPFVECKQIKIPEVKLNITPPPVTSFALSGEEVAHMVDQAVSASLANRLQKIIDGSIDNRLESALDSNVRSAMLRVNDETAKKQIEFAEPNATLIKPSFFYSNS